jgi:hypothetical protein
MSMVGSEVAKKSIFAGVAASRPAYSSSSPRSSLASCSTHPQQPEHNRIPESQQASQPREGSASMAKGSSCSRYAAAGKAAVPAVLQQQQQQQRLKLQSGGSRTCSRPKRRSASAECRVLSLKAHTAMPWKSP